MKKRNKFITLALALTLLVTGCGASENTKKVSENKSASQNNVAVQEKINYVGPVNPNDPATKNEFGDFVFMPTIYMQDYEDKMPNGKAVSEAGNLITCLSMLSSYYSATWITPDVLINEYPNLFDDKGNIITDSTLETFCKGTYKKTNYDFYALSEGLANGYDFALVRIPNPSKFGNLSTYMIIEGISDDFTMGVRDPNKSNIEQFALYSDFDNIPRYEVGDMIIALGEEGTPIYLFSDTVINDENTDNIEQEEINENEEVTNEE